MASNLPQPFDSDEGAQEKRRVVRIDVRGNDPAKWARFRDAFIARIDETMQQFLDTTIDVNRGTTIREEAEQLTSAMLDFARNKLRRPGAEVDKLEAEISEIYAKRMKSIAEVEKVQAEAAEERRATALKELCKQLAFTKAFVLQGDDDETAILFGRQIDEFLRLVKELNLLGET